ncbi:MAG: TPM domain-containing protein [Nevskia sp.]|nr:TPM domain-containing protein [Nevskia sp.]
MPLSRILRHLLTTHWRVRRAFPPATLDAIEQAIKSSEAAHVGQIRFAVEGALHALPLFKGQMPRERAIEVFSLLRIWDTEYNNGVLIYLLLADHAVEIVADRGIHAKVNAEAWTAVCRDMEAAFGAGRYESGVVNGIKAVTRHLVEHFPTSAAGSNELPDRPVVL